MLLDVAGFRQPLHLRDGVVKHSEKDRVVETEAQPAGYQSDEQWTGSTSRRASAARL